MNTSSRDIVSSPTPPTLFELQRIAAGDKECCQTLIDRWETPIKAIASGYASRQPDLDDLMQIGRVVVYRTALKYNTSFGVPFAHYAKRAIKNSMMKESARLARQRQFETPLDVYIGETNHAPPQLLQDNECTNSIKEWVKDLPEPHPTIFRLLYLEKVPQRVAARAMGVSQPRVSQLHRSFLALARIFVIGQDN